MSGLDLGMGLGLGGGAGGTPSPSMQISSQSVGEDAASGATIGALSVTNGTGVYTFTITADPDNKFDLSGANVVTTATLNYETATSHQFTAQADNGVDPVLTRTFTISVTNVFEAASLSALTLSSSSATLGAATTINILGATTGSTLTADTLPAGMTLNSAARTITGTPTTLATTAIALTETLADSSNSPRVSNVSLEVVEAPAQPTFLIEDLDTEASATPSSVVLTVDDDATGFRLWTGAPASASETEFTLYVKKNSDAVYQVKMERYQGRIFNAAPGDTFAFGTSDGRTLKHAQMVVPTALPTPSGATGTANCDKAVPGVWVPSTAHVTLPTTSSAFQIDFDGTKRLLFISEKDGNGVWSPPRAVWHSATRHLKVQCNYTEIAIANEDGATLAITAPTGTTIGGTSATATLSTIPAVTGTTHNVSTVSALKTAIAAAVDGDEIVLAAGTYSLDVAITDASFTANEGASNQGAEGILIRGATGDRDDVILTGDGTSTNGNWSLTQTGATAFTTFQDLTFDAAAQAIKFEFLSGKLNLQNVLMKGGTGTDLFNANNTSGALIINALWTLLQDGAGDLWNFDGNATYNATSAVNLYACSGLRAGPSNNAYQCLTSHHDLPINIEGGLWQDAHLNILANGSDTTITSLSYAKVRKGARNAGISDTIMYRCDIEVTSQVTGNSDVPVAVGNHFYGTKNTTTYGVLRNVPIVKHNWVEVTSGRGSHNSVQAEIVGNIFIGLTDGIRNGDAASVQGTSSINFNALSGCTNGMNHPTTTNDPAEFKCNAAKSNTTSVNTTTGAKTSLTGDYNVLDATVDSDYIAGGNDTTGSDAALDSDYFPTASGNCDDNGDYGEYGAVGGSDPFGLVFIYKQTVAPRGARSRPIIRSSAELYPDFY